MQISSYPIEQRSQKREEMEYIIQTTPRFNGEEQGKISDSWNMCGTRFAYVYKPGYGNLTFQLKSKLGRLVIAAFKNVGHQENCYLQ